MTTNTSRMKHRRLILGSCAGIVAVLLVFYLSVPRLVRSRAVDVLRGEFGSDVRVQSFDVSSFPRVHIVLHGLLIGNDVARPMIEARTADARSGWVPWHIRMVTLEGLSVHMPNGTVPTSPARRRWLTPTIDEIVTDHATIEVGALHFQIADLRVTNFSFNHAAGFSATLVNSEPRAEAQVRGHIGPWNGPDPRLTPLSGTYRLPNCDLATLPGLKGILSSRGRFAGVFQRARIAGDADVDGFSLSSSGRTEPVYAKFQAAIDAVEGSAAIDSISGSLQNSAFSGSGLARNIQDDGLREIAMDVSMPQGRLEDVLPLGVPAKSSPVVGSLVVHATLSIQPGQRDILSRLRMVADFMAANARFSSLDLREKLRNASRKAQGHPNDKAAGSSSLNMQGQVTLANGVAQFSNLDLDLEGASASLNGSYQLASERLDLHGEVLMDAKLSQTATGATAMLLKVAEPLFRSKRGGSRVPIKIGGTRSDPQFGIGLGK
jgi:hypothetical protein